VLPIGLLQPEAKEDVIVFIAGLPIEPEDRKRLLVEWSKITGVALTEEMVSRAGAK